MHERGNWGNFHAFKSTRGAPDGDSASNGATGCSTWFYIAIVFLFALNEIRR